jgi:acyl dehydratase
MPATVTAHDTGLLARPFDELAVGERFATPACTVTETDIARFSPLPAEPAFAERFVDAMLVLSYAIRLVPLDPRRIAALHRVSDPVLKGPVRLGDAISVEGYVERLEPIDRSAGIATCALTILNRERRMLARATIELLWRRDAARASELASEQAWDDDPILP